MSEVLLAARGEMAAAARDVRPVCFAMVMATAVVAAGLRLTGLPVLPAVLLCLAAATLVVLAAASSWGVAVFPDALREWLSRPYRAFSSFALVAACAMLCAGLASDGYRYPAAVLAGTAGMAWLVLSCLVPGRVVAQRRARPATTEADGTWYLWAVGTESLAIAAVAEQADGLLAAQEASAVGLAAWLAGIVAYLAVTVVVLARLLTAGPGSSAIAPYWIAAGAASISALAAARLLGISGATVVDAIRPVATDLALAFWAVATLLLPILAVVTIARSRHSGRLCYRAEAWTIVFPLGMYAVSGRELGTATGLSPVRGIGAVAIWPAAAAWVVAFAAMAASAFRGLGRWLRGERVARVKVPAQRFKYQAMVTLLPSGNDEPVALSGPDCRMIVRTQPGLTHHHADIFSALVSAGGDSLPDSRRLLVTMTLIGCGVGDCLDPGEHFTLWRGRDIAEGVVTRRIFT